MNDALSAGSVAQMSVALASGAATAEQLMAQHLARIEARDEDVRAWSWLDPQQAMAAAEAASEAISKGVRRSPLEGIPVAVKDLIDTADMPTTYGSAIYKEHRPTQDAAMVTALKKAGAVVMGKTVSTEFACFTPGATRNPINRDHTPGGSSSGSAAAVADCQAPFAIGTQTAGSVIRPAAFNGIVGLKPTFGVLPTPGTFSLCPTLDTLGTFSRNIADQRLLLTALAPHIEIANAPAKPRMLVCQTPFWRSASEEMQHAFTRFAADCSHAGIETEAYEFVPAFGDLLAASQTIMGAEARRGLRTELQQHADLISPPLLELLHNAEAITNSDEAAAHHLRARCQYLLQQIFSRADFILTPATCGTAPRLEEGTGDPLFNRIWTLLGVPAISFPVATADNGLPLAVQLIAAPWNDHALIDFADKLNNLTR